MKKIHLLVLVIVSSIVFTSCSCESRSEANAKRKKVIEARNAEGLPGDRLKGDTAVVTPLSIGVSSVDAELTEYPKFDGGEGYSATYTIGIRLKGEGKSRSIKIVATGYSPFAGGAKQKEEVVNAYKMREAILNSTPENVNITLVKNSIIKISTKEVWEGKNFTPEKLLWQKPNYLN